MTPHGWDNYYRHNLLRIIGLDVICGAIVICWQAGCVHNLMSMVFRNHRLLKPTHGEAVITCEKT